MKMVNCEWREEIECELGKDSKRDWVKKMSWVKECEGGSEVKG